MFLYFPTTFHNDVFLYFPTTFQNDDFVFSNHFSERCFCIFQPLFTMMFFCIFQPLFRTMFFFLFFQTTIYTHNNYCISALKRQILPTPKDMYTVPKSLPKSPHKNQAGHNWSRCYGLGQVSVPDVKKTWLIQFPMLLSWQARFLCRA